MTNTALVLNATGEPQTTMAMRRAMRLVLLGRAEIVEAEGQDVKTGSGVLARPSVIRLKKYVHVPRRMRRKVSNTLLFARDRYHCMYCGRSEAELGRREHLNRDHVVSLSKGGENSWTNCVTACSSCNSAKADKSLGEAEMKLRTVPKEPHFVYLQWTIRKLTPIQVRYVRTFYGVDYLESVKQLEGVVTGPRQEH